MIIRGHGAATQASRRGYLRSSAFIGGYNFKSRAKVKSRPPPRKKRGGEDDGRPPAPGPKLPVGAREPDPRERKRGRRREEDPVGPAARGRWVRDEIPHLQDREGPNDEEDAAGGDRQHPNK